MLQTDFHCKSFHILTNSKFTVMDRYVSVLTAASAKSITQVELCTFFATHAMLNESAGPITLDFVQTALGVCIWRFLMIQTLTPTQNSAVK